MSTWPAEETETLVLIARRFPRPPQRDHPDIQARHDSPTAAPVPLGLFLMAEAISPI